MMKHSRLRLTSFPFTRRAGGRGPGSTRRARFERLEDRRVLSVPTLAAIDPVTLFSGSPLHIPLDAFDADGDALTFSVASSNSNVAASVTEGNRSMRISVQSIDDALDGDMILELFEDRVPRATNRIITLAESGFYDGIIFHRVMDGFMIQTGDPLGTGSGGSDYPDFDDQFDVDLQHNTTGVLSMAKSSDDTNNSQFFIVDTPASGSDYPRHLDYNHSVFGQLVEGFDVLEAISEAYTGTDTKPDVDIVMESVEIFVDHENGVLMLKAPEGYTGEADITVTVNDGQSNGVPVVFHVTVTPDAVDSDPYLADVPEIRTTVDTPVTFNLTAVDVEENDAHFVDEYTLYSSSLAIPLLSHVDLEYVVDFDTGEVTVTPTNGLVGIHPITVGTALYADAIDYQVVPVYIVPDEAPTAQLDLTLVRELTEVDAMGETNALPDSQWIDEWDTFVIEVWATVTESGQFGVHTVSTDLTFDNELFTATQIEHGLVFTENLGGQINNAAGTITNLGGTTGVFSIDGYPGAYPNCPVAPDNVQLYGDNRPVLVARIYFEPKQGGSGVAHNAVDDYLAPQTDLGIALTNSHVLWSGTDQTALTVGTLDDAELWPVMYDMDDNNEIGLGDLSYFAAAYGHEVGESGVTHTWASDFDHNGEVGLGDLSYFAAVYRRTANSEGRCNYPANFPADWHPISESAALMGTVVGGSSSSDSSADTTPDAGGLSDPTLAQAFIGATPSRPTQRRMIDYVDQVMRLYDPMVVR